MWFRKVVKCELCKSKVRKKDTWKLHMNTSEGMHQLTVCKDCADTMEKIKENVGIWLEQ
jgi:ribosome-binding protein aMBF1 (putative translation factor)